MNKHPLKEIYQKSFGLLKEELEVGQSIQLSMPYGSTFLKFKAKVLSVAGSTCKVQYITGGKKVTSDVPVEWATAI